MSANMSLNLAAIARSFHDQGFNVTAIAAGSKEPAHPWNTPHAPWATERQPVDVVYSLGHGWNQRRRVHNGQVFPPVDRIGLICGIGDLRCIDIDAIKHDDGTSMPVPEHVFFTLLDALHLPHDYPWSGRSASGNGWHILLRCADPLPDHRSVQRWLPIADQNAAQPQLFGHLELRWHTCQVALPRRNDIIGYHPAMHGTEPATRSLAAIWTAVTSFAYPEQSSADRPFGQDRSSRPDTPPELLVHQGTNSGSAACRQTSNAIPAFLSNALHRLQQANPGERNRALNAAAYAAGRAVAGGYASPALRDQLVHMAVARGLPIHEAVQTANSGWRAGLRDGPPHQQRAADLQPHGAPFADPDHPLIAIAWGEEIDALAPPTPLIHGMLNVGGVALLVGPSESGKSTVAVHLACSVAQHYPVIYVAGESAGLIRNQIRAWEQTYQCNRGRIGVVPHAVSLDNPLQVAALQHAVVAANARMVIIDTLSSCIAGVDENAPAMSGIVAALNRLAQTTNAAVVVLHHPTKSNSSPYRGHSSLYNNTDTTLTLERPPDDPALVRVTPVRHKGARRTPVLLRMERCALQDDPWTDPRMAPATVPVVIPALPGMHAASGRPTAIQRMILDMIASVQHDSGASSLDIGRWMQTHGIAESAVRQELARMAQHGWITPADTPIAPRRLTPEGQRIIEEPDPHDPRLAERPVLDINPYLDSPAPAPAAPTSGEGASFQEQPTASGHPTSTGQSRGGEATNQVIAHGTETPGSAAPCHHPVESGDAADRRSGIAPDDAARGAPLAHVLTAGSIDPERLSWYGEEQWHAC